MGHLHTLASIIVTQHPHKPSCMHTYLVNQKCRHTFTLTNIDTHTFTLTNIDTHTFTLTHTHTHPYSSSHTLTHKHTHSHTLTHTQTHHHTHTHTDKWQSWDLNKNKKITINSIYIYIHFISNTLIASASELLHFTCSIFPPTSSLVTFTFLLSPIFVNSRTSLSPSQLAIPCSHERNKMIMI